MDTIKFNELYELYGSSEESTITVPFNENVNIKVIQYLPAEEKNDLITLSLQQAWEENGYNEFKLDTIFQVYIVFFYSDIEFTDEEKQNLFDTYDKLYNLEILDKVIGSIPEEEYDDLCHFLDTQKENNLKSRTSFSYTAQRIVDTLPLQAERMKEVIDNVDFSKYQQVINVAAATGANNVSN